MADKLRTVTCDNDIKIKVLEGGAIEIGAASGQRDEAHITHEMAKRVIVTLQSIVAEEAAAV